VATRWSHHAGKRHLLRQYETAWQVGYSENGERTELPRLAQQLVSRSTQASVLIPMSIAGVPIYGHVFGECWMEFDVPARHINGQESVDALADFVIALGRALGKEVRATPEAAHDAPMFVYDASMDPLYDFGVIALPSLRCFAR
jgi:hypothetical protein